MLTTFKQKLQEDMKTVLTYQMVTGKSLQCIDPRKTIEDLKREIEDNIKNEHKLKKNYFKSKKLSITNPLEVNNIEDLYKYKEMRFIKYINKPNIVYSITINNIDSERTNNKYKFVEILNNLLNSLNHPYTIRIRQIHQNVIQFAFGTPDENDKYIEYVQNQLRDIRNYRLFINNTTRQLLSLKPSIEHLHQRFENRFYIKEIKSLDRLELIDYSNIDNCNFNLYIITTHYFVIADKTFHSLSKTLDAINNFKELNKIEFDMVINYEKRIDKEGVNVTIRISITVDDDLIEQKELGSEGVEVNSLETVSAFNNYVFTHGLRAYYSERITYEEAVQTLVDRNDIAISCSYKSNHLGPIGVYITGDCKYASHFDVNSVCNRETGKRFIDKDKMKQSYCISSPKEIIQLYYAGEAIVTNFKIVGIWVKEYELEDFQEELQLLQDLTGIEKVDII